LSSAKTEGVETGEIFAETVRRDIAMKVVILHDRITEESREDERDALVQAGVVSVALSKLGYDPVTLAFDLDAPNVIETLKAIQPAFVFNLVESVNGQGRLIHLAPALLEALGIPYTGVSAEAMLTTSNKILTKQILSGTKITTPLSFSGSGLEDASRFVKTRYIVKSVWEHASVGLDDNSVCEPESYGDLMERLAETSRRLGGKCFAEAYIEGREFNISLLAGSKGVETLPLAEIHFTGYAEGKPRVVGYPAKWDAGSFEYQNTPRSFDFPPEDAPLLNRLEALSRACWRLFGLRGYARVDVRVDADGCPWVLEINANPCLSPDAGFAAALERGGVPFVDAVDRIVRASPSFGVR